MLNNLVLVGRLIADPQVEELDSYKKVSKIVIAVNRAFKNVEGIYETDFIPIILWNGIAENVCDYLKKGDLIGIKGRIESNEDKNINIIAEKVTFLSSKQKEEKENE